MTDWTGAVVQGNWLRDYPWKSAYGPQDRPLESFYIPALSRSVSYDRIAGFFSSYSLAVAAQGVAELISRGGSMRLLVGASLSDADIKALMGGTPIEDTLSARFLSVLNDPAALADTLVNERLKVMAWLVANGRLQIRVVIEAEPYSNQPVASGGYFHAKGGLLYDDAGDGIAFSGSINETATAWRYNYERFHVFTSWKEPTHFQQEADTFKRLWENSEMGWLSVELPEAVRQELLQIAPQEAPGEEPVFGEAVERDNRARWIAQFLRDGPYLAQGGHRVGVETAAVSPFPHQRSVAYDFLDNFPCNRLLADEVGLGKTIEAGLILRSLLISGRINRCLVLVPRSLAKQWQEELRHRFLVEAPFYDGSRFVFFDEPHNRYQNVSEDTDPWETSPVLIASAQLAKRDERAESLLQASQWDLVILDEAHHARRRDFQDLNRYRPNKLLRLLERLKDRTRSMLFLTATPMQVHPIEVYDLLRVLNMPRDWQDNQNGFLEYFQQFNYPYDEVPWEDVLPLLRSAIQIWGLNGEWRAKCASDLGTVGYHRLASTIEHGSAREVRKVPTKLRNHVREALRHHSPVRFLVSRYTRNLLRDYYNRGLTSNHVPEREPNAVWLEMSEEEGKLYRALETYISTYYKRYEEERRGLGFIMTVYRRRLTSSLYALQQSLIRHRQFLTGQWVETELPAGLEDEDIEEADLNDDLADELSHLPIFAQEETNEIDRLLESIGRLDTEAKLIALKNDLHKALNTWDQVLVFTQYTDTMDFLRKELFSLFGSTLGCYSGRGGERWSKEENNWVSLSKEKMQTLFANGEIRVLICTEAGGEGLNLQNCGVLFNYDMPWNPMKVEQRIGRVDRIGQIRKKVHINHYFYVGTVEAEVYKALGNRIGWFETVVGGLQPILQRAHTAIQRAAMETPEARKGLLQSEISRMEQECDRAESEVPPISQWSPLALHAMPDAPITISDLEWVLSSWPPWRNYNGTPEFLSYGNPVFEERIALPPPASRPDLIRKSTESGTITYVQHASNKSTEFRKLADLTGLLE